MSNQGTRELRSGIRELKEAHTPSAQKLFYDIKDIIVHAAESQELVYEDIEPDHGVLLVHSLNEDKDVERAHSRINYNSESRVFRVRIMPTDVHDCHQDWVGNELDSMLIQGFLTVPEKRLLCTRVGTTFEGFLPPYSLSSKEPDLCLRPNTQNIPTIAIESGWSESWPHLYNDMRLWLIGGAPTVKLVILLRWSKITGNRVKGVLEVFARNMAGIPTSIQKEDIFPQPAGPIQRIPVSRDQLFGTAILANRNPNDTFFLSIDELRQVAIPSIQKMGYTPA